MKMRNKLSKSGTSRASRRIGLYAFYFALACLIGASIAIPAGITYKLQAASAKEAPQDATSMVSRD